MPSGEQISVQNGHTYLVTCSIAYATGSAGIQSVSVDGRILTVTGPSGVTTPFDVIDLGVGEDTTHAAKVLIVTPDGIFSPSEYEPATLTRRALYNLANGKQDPITIDSTISDSSTNPVQNSAIYTALAGKQATLVSGTNIKTVNNNSLLGSGNLTVGLTITTYSA